MRHPLLVDIEVMSQEELEQQYSLLIFDQYIVDDLNMKTYPTLLEWALAMIEEEEQEERTYSMHVNLNSSKKSRYVDDW